MIDKNYKKFYINHFKRIQNKADKHFYDEAAIPSYTHSNTLISRIFWDRLNSAFSLAEDINNKKVLDFGSGGGVTFKYLADSGGHISACEKHFLGLTKKMAMTLKINIQIYKDISEIKDTFFDIIFALDVLEHIENLKPILEILKKISHEKTKIIISGPTENTIYRLGKHLAGFKGRYHLRNIYDVERELRESGFMMKKLKKLYFPIILFRVSLWNYAR